MPDELTELRTSDLEIGLYPSDIAISGRKQPVARARAAIASRLTSTAAHLTTSKEAQAVEDRIEAIARSDPARDESGNPILTSGVAGELRAIDELLARLEVDYDEWEVLYRMRLQVERDLLAGARVGDAFPGSAQPAEPRQPEHVRVGVAAVLGAAGVVLAALDVGIAVMDRLRPSSR